MMAITEKSPDYTACDVPDVLCSIKHISGISSGNDTYRECDRTLVFEKSIFSEKLGGFENYTCSGVTTMNRNTQNFL